MTSHALYLYYVYSKYIMCIPICWIYYMPTNIILIGHLHYAYALGKTIELLYRVSHSSFWFNSNSIRSLYYWHRSILLLCWHYKSCGYTWPPPPPSKHEIGGPGSTIVCFLPSGILSKSFHNTNRNRQKYCESICYTEMTSHAV